VLFEHPEVCSTIQFLFHSEKTFGKCDRAFPIIDSSLKGKECKSLHYSSQQAPRNLETIVGNTLVF
jgi:hypothetical protein